MLTLIVGVLTAIFGAASGAAISYFLTKKQNKREKIWAMMAELYCSDVLNSISTIAYQTYEAIRVCALEEMDGGIASFREKIAEMKNRERLLYFPANYSAVPKMYEDLFSLYSICREKEEATRFSNLINDTIIEMGVILNVTSDALLELSPKRFKDIPFMIKDSEDFLKYEKKIEGVQKIIKQMINEIRDISKLPESDWR